MKDGDRQKLLDSIPKDGKAIGNKRLRSLLGWNEDKFWKVRDDLIEEAVLALGRGRGGSVKRASAEVLDVPDSEEQ